VKGLLDGTDTACQCPADCDRCILESSTQASCQRCVAGKALLADGACVTDCPVTFARVTVGAKPAVEMCLAEHRCIDGFMEGTKSICSCMDVGCSDCMVKVRYTA